MQPRHQRLFLFSTRDNSHFENVFPRTCPSSDAAMLFSIWRALSESFLAHDRFLANERQGRGRIRNNLCISQHTTCTHINLHKYLVICNEWKMIHYASWSDQVERGTGHRETVSLSSAQIKAFSYGSVWLMKLYNFIIRHWFLKVFFPTVYKRWKYSHL